MDNQTKFLVLNKISDWQKGLCYNLDFSDQGISLKKTDDYKPERVISLDDPGELSGVTDFSPGKCHVIYFLDAVSSRMSAYDSKNRRVIWVDDIKGLCVKPDKIEFVPGTFYIMTQGGQEQRIIALAQINHQIRWIMDRYPKVSVQGCELEEFNPADFTADEEGNLYALNNPSTGIHDKAVFKIHPGGYITGRYKIDPDIDVNSTCISFRHSSLYILDKKNKALFIYKGQTQNVKTQLTKFIQLTDFQPSGLCVDSKGNIFIGDHRQKKHGEEDDRFIRKFSPLGQYLGTIRGYRGQVNKLEIDKEDNIHVYDSSKQEITVLTPDMRILGADETALPEGWFISRSFDSTTPETKWHKLVVDADIPADTQVRVSYLISDEKGSGTVKDIDSFISDQNILPETKIEILKYLNWSNLPPNPKDALITGQTGRYLWLKVELAANERQTPLLKRMRVYFPRVSFLEYLPAVYQYDESSRDFLERFLSLYQTYFYELESQIVNIKRYFNADTVSGAFLQWLASWLAIAVDDSWNDDKLRKLVKKAPELYRKRGTREGIEDIIEIFTESRPIILEHFQIKWVSDSSFKNVLLKLFNDDPFTFTVLLKPDQIKTKNDRLTVQRIVDAEKPAHTKAKVVVLSPWIYLDMHTYLGINTYLTKPDLRLDVGSAMPRDTVLSDILEAGQVQRRSRLGVDTVLT